MDAERRFEQFHGKPSRKTNSLNFNIPKKLIYLGDAVAIEYKCDKLNGGGDGHVAIYRHKFSPGAIVCMDETAKRQLYIIGGKIAVDDAGIKR
jgi:hypothetical protein